MAARKAGKRTARIRRQRGYNWEDTLVKRYRSVKGWKAFRLGSPSIRLPDVLAVNGPESTIIAIEAKSGTTMSLFVPAEQIQRCMEWVNVFDIYGTGVVLLAFKFLSKKRVGRGVYEGRELREFFKAWNMQRKAVDCHCTYDGTVFAKINNKKTELKLQDWDMPFGAGR